MKNKPINVAEILKKCPKGMKLYSPVFEDIYFESVDKKSNTIKCYIHYTEYDEEVKFNQFGYILFKSGCGYNIWFRKSKCAIFPKGKTTWKGFVPPCKPKYKVGNAITFNGVSFNMVLNGTTLIQEKGVIAEITEDKYIFTDGTYTDINNQDNWNPAKFYVQFFKPSDKVLVRDNSNQRWKLDFFSCIDDEKLFRTITGTYIQCIPYNDINEGLLDKTDDCIDFYKTWEE